MDRGILDIELPLNLFDSREGDVIDDKPHEACGVVGVFGSKNEDTAPLLREGLAALQHRGQESAGLAVINGDLIHSYKNMGMVDSVLTDTCLAGIRGDRGIGHTRYSTAGGSSLRNAQPFAIDSRFGPLAVCHNGTLTNADELRRQVISRGGIFESTSDTEVLLHLIVQSPYSVLEDAVIWAISQLKGAFCLLILSQHILFAIRDPRGVRPLVLGKIEPNPIDRIDVVASEDCALIDMGATPIREISPGEMVTFSHNGTHFQLPFVAQSHPCQCVFEHIYFARPDSAMVFGRSVAEARVTAGRLLAREHPVDADVVIGVPDSAAEAAAGFAEESGIPRQRGLFRNRYRGNRTFIQPVQSQRDSGVSDKFKAVDYFIDGNRVVIVDDSIVRATTIQKLVKLVRKHGATEVHVRIASPPKRWPCFYGIDTAERGTLIASERSVEEICNFIGANSLGYLSVEGTLRASGQEANNPSRFCTACFTGKYDIALPDSQIKRVIGDTDHIQLINR